MKLLSLIAISLTLCAPANAQLKPTHLVCEHLTNPIGVQTAVPRLSWALESTIRGDVQTAYRIRVASSLEGLRKGRADLWDSGKVASAESIHIPYAGKPLKSGQQCWWTVRAWDKNGRPTPEGTVSWDGPMGRGKISPAFWEMGLLDPADWHGKWIGRTEETAYHAAPHLRKAFEAHGKVARATIYVCGLGYHELSLNGTKVGDHHLDPGYTRFDRRALYVVHDVTNQLKSGRNAIGVILGTGWLNTHTRAVWYFDKAPWRQAPKLLVEMRITYANGKTETIVSDHSWKTAEGPITFDSIYGGETYDARKEITGWDTANFDDSSWQSALEVTPLQGKLVAQQMPPIRAKEVIASKTITEPKPGVFVFDAKQNMAGHSRLTVSGPAGTKVTLRYGERLKADGTVNQADIGQHIAKTDPPQKFQTDEFILKGSGKETFEARFTYHGFQYIEMTGFPGKPTLDNLKAVFVHTDVPEAGTFVCSNDLLNKIQRATRMSYFSNLQSIPTDCPHREKNGWTGDAHLAAEQALFNFAPAAVYAKWINDLDDEMRPTGELPGIVPSSGWGYEWGNGPAWDSAFLLIPWYTYQYTGDTRILTDHYEKFKRYVDYLTSKAKNGIVSIGLGDWVPYKTVTPESVTSTGYYYVDTKIVSDTARLLGKTDEAKKYADLAETTRIAFNKQFFNDGTGSYSNGGQTALACALYQGFVDPKDRDRVLANLITAVEKNDNHIDTGILGAKYLLNTLLENGRADVAYKVASQKTYPSWGWWLEQGASTLWESWESKDDSRNHIMFGDISAWMYKALGGIQLDPAAPGFKHFILRPNILGELTDVNVNYQSMRGEIHSEWELLSDPKTLVWKVRIPANTSATVYVPCASLEELTEGGKPLSEAVGVKVLGFQGDFQGGSVVCEMGSGSYVFRSVIAK